MSCSKSLSDIGLKAAFASWGIKDVSCVSPVADVAGSLNNTYFEFSTPLTEYYVWINSGGTGVDPTIVNKTGIEVTIPNGASITDIVAALKLAIETAVSAWVTISDDGLSIELEARIVGKIISPLIDGAVPTLFIFEVLRVGIGGYLGRTSEGIEISKEISQFDLKSNQTGESLIDAYRTGTALTCSMNLIEMNQTRWETIVGGGVGDVHTPAGGTPFVGYGTSRDYKSLLESAGELQLKPVESSDNLENFTFFKCVPVPTTVNYSGTEVFGLTVEFRAFIDPTKDKKIQFGGFGDNTQDMR